MILFQQLLRHHQLPEDPPPPKDPPPPEKPLSEEELLEEPLLQDPVLQELLEDVSLVEDEPRRRDPPAVGTTGCPKTPEAMTTSTKMPKA